jgi:DNA polymerase
MGGLGIDVGEAEAVSALEWWLEAGVDQLVAESPRNWLEVAPPVEPVAKVAKQETPLSGSVIADMPPTLALFRDWLPGFSDASSDRSNAKPVLPAGEEGAEVMILAESPGRDEVTAGLPIGGEAWDLAKNMLASIGFTPKQAYFANLSCFSLPRSRADRDMLQRCGTVARHHIALAKPKRLLLLGDAPSLALLGKTAAEARGHVHKVEGVRTVVTLHPRMILGDSGRKQLAWKDLLLLTESDG